MINIEHIEKWLSKAKEKGVFEELSKIPDLLINTRLFWNNYDGLTNGRKWLQFFTFSFVFIIILWWVMFRETSFSYLGKALITEIIVAISSIVIIFLGNIIIDKSLKSKFWHFVVYCCYVRFLVLTPHIMALHLFVLSESYFYLALSIILVFIGEIYLYFVSAYVFQKGWKRTVLAFLMTLICLNVYDGFFILTGFQRTYDSNFDDVILEERFYQGKNLKGGYDIPSHVCSWESIDKNWYLYSSPFDSIATKRETDDVTYMNEIKEDADSLALITERCKFAKNRDFFQMMLVQRQLIQFVHDNKMYKSNPIEKVEAIYKDSILIDRIIFRRFNQDVDSLNTKLVKFEIDQHSQYESAMSVSNILVVFHPVHIIHNWLKDG